MYTVTPRTYLIPCIPTESPWWLQHHSQEAWEACTFFLLFYIFYTDCSFSPGCQTLTKSYEQRKKLVHLQTVTRPVARRGLNVPAFCGAVASHGLVIQHMELKNCSDLNPKESFLLQGTADEWPFSTSSLSGLEHDKAGTLHSNHSN